MTPRRLRELGAAAAVVAVVSGILVAAVQADGRTSVRTEVNDGGAWLVRRSDGLTGQLAPTGSLDGSAIGLRRLPAEWTTNPRPGRGILGIAGDPTEVQVPLVTAMSDHGV